MDKKQARSIAATMLLDLVKHQPGMVQFPSPSGPTNFGADAAKFCTEFIDTYSEWVMKNAQER